MKIKELVEVAGNIDKVYIENVFELEDYFCKKHGELEVKGYYIKINRHATQNTITETLTMVINPKVNK